MVSRIRWTIKILQIKTGVHFKLGEVWYHMQVRHMSKTETKGQYFKFQTNALLILFNI